MISNDATKHEHLGRFRPKSDVWNSALLKICAFVYKLGGNAEIQRYWKSRGFPDLSKCASKSGGIVGILTLRNFRNIQLSTQPSLKSRPKSSADIDSWSHPTLFTFTNSNKVGGFQSFRYQLNKMSVHGVQRIKSHKQSLDDAYNPPSK